MILGSGVPFARPTLGALVTRLRSDFRGRLAFVNPLLRRAMTDVVATVWAGAAHGMHGHLEWLTKQMFAVSAEKEYLRKKHGSLYNLDPVPATYAAGTVTATGVNGEEIAEDTILVRPSDGAKYVVTALATIAGGEATVSIESELAGEAYNLDEGEVLNFETPLDDIDSEVTVDEDGIQGGHDEQSEEAYRALILLRKRRPPTGGSDQDWIKWGLEVAGVTRVWVYRHENGLGTVVVRFMLGDRGEVFPEPADVTAMQAKLDSERPTTAEVLAEAPIELTVPFTIEIDPDSTANRAAVQAELEDLFDRVGEPGDGAGRGTILLSEIRTAIGVAVSDYTLTSPVADVVPDVGERPVVGAITWV